MPRAKKSADQLRVKVNLTIHPEIREWANAISLRRRRSISQIFEELVESEWQRFQGAAQAMPVAPSLPPQQQVYFYPPPGYYIAQQQQHPQQ